MAVVKIYGWPMSQQSLHNQPFNLFLRLTLENVDPIEVSGKAGRPEGD